MLRYVNGKAIQVDKNAFDLADSIVSNAKYALPSVFHCGSKPAGNCCITHVIGLPYHPAKRHTMELTPYQMEFADMIRNSRPKKYIVNKARQIGFTEIVLRVILYEALCGKYAGGKIAIIAGTNADLARKNLRRLYDMCRNIRYVVKDGYFRGHVMNLHNGTVIEAFKANEEAITGDTNYRCVFIDESAKWRLRDDSAVFNSILPLVETNNADLFLISTPKGPIKKFYEIWTDEHSDFEKLKYDIHAASGSMYTPEQIQEILQHSIEDVNQEYLCQFTVGRNSIFADYTTEKEDFEELDL